MTAPATVARPAIVRDLRRGHEYVASSATLTGDGAITFTGQLRVRDTVGERRYRTTTRTLPLRNTEVEWIGALPA